MNWAVFLETGFSITLDHDNEPTEKEMEEGFLALVGGFLKGEIEFTFVADDPVEDD